MLKTLFVGSLVFVALLGNANAQSCRFQLRTYQAQANPDSVFLPVGNDTFELKVGQKYDLYVQYESKSQFPYLLKADIWLESGDAIDVRGVNKKYGNIEVTTVKPGTARFAYVIEGREDGGPLSLPSGCEKGTFYANVTQAQISLQERLSKTLPSLESLAIDLENVARYEETYHSVKVSQYVRGPLLTVRNLMTLANSANYSDAEATKRLQFLVKKFNEIAMLLRTNGYSTSLVDLAQSGSEITQSLLQAELEERLKNEYKL